MTKKTTIALAGAAFLSLLAAGSSMADVFVNGYYRSDGTYVQPHHRNNPDSNPYNNWSSIGNVNPYTGEAGFRHHDLGSFPRLRF